MTVLPGWSSDRQCLGPRVADLADGQLSLAETEAAFAHVAGCDRCRVALDAEQAASEALTTHAPDPSADFLARLRAIPTAEEERARREAVPFAPVVPPAPTRPAGGAGVRPSTPATSARPASRRRRVRTAVGSAAGVAVLMVAVAVGGAPAVVGSPSVSVPSIAPVVDALTDEHAVSTERMPFSGPQVVTAAFTRTQAPAIP